MTAGEPRHRPGAAGCGRALRRGVLAIAAALLAAAGPAAALDLRVVYVDPPGQGFDDPSLGGPRRAAFEHAVARWASALAGATPIAIEASMRALGGDATSAVLAQTGALSLHRNFAGGLPDLWYGAALGNHLAGADLNGAQFAEIGVVFNSDVDGPAVLGEVGWHYGTDAQPGADIDFVTIALHEIGHGLNFFDVLHPDTGEALFEGALGIFERRLERHRVGPLDLMYPAERVAAIRSGDLMWNGLNVVTALREPARMYAPPGFEPGSSVSHFDVSLEPDEVMEPFYTGANHDLGLLLPALMDMGWAAAVPTATPRSTRSVVRNPTATPTPSRTATPTGSPPPARYVAYVTNFDAGSVSVLDGRTHRVVETIPVGGGPLGVAVGPNQQRVYVANFHTGTLSIIDRARARLEDAIAVSDAAHSVAIAPDERTAYVTDTFTGALLIVDLDARAPVASLPIGLQPAGLALTADGRRLFVANYGGNELAVVDTELRSVVARVRLHRRAAPIAVALGRRHGLGYVATQYDTLLSVDLRTYGLLSAMPAVVLSGPVEAVALAPDEEMFFALTHSETGGSVLFVDRASGALRHTLRLGTTPEAVAVQPDGAQLYVADSSGDAVFVVDVASRALLATVPVGAAPMGVAVAAVPPPPCPGDCRQTGRVEIADLIAAIAVALGELPLSACAAADGDGDGRIVVAELVAALRSLLDGCP